MDDRRKLLNKALRSSYEEVRPSVGCFASGYLSYLYRLQVCLPKQTTGKYVNDHVFKDFKACKLLARNEAL
ncbi:MAG: hypothetical protein QXL83_08370 [Zestosphaera sp.]